MKRSILSFSLTLLITLSMSITIHAQDRIVTADMVKTEFLHGWNGYKQYAWGHDALKPLSKSYRDWHKASLLMTPVDAFDTMELMGLTKEAGEAKELIFKELSFDRDFEIQSFEITIRLLGGLLSAYQLDGDKRFLDLAEDLGKRLLPVFNSKTGMPYRYVNLRTGAIRDSINNPAEIGTALIEFGTLSKITGNPVYFEKAKQAQTACFNHRSKIGLVGTWINVETGEWTDKSSHISGAIDSYYEYLLKCSILFNDKDCKAMWDSSITAINTYLADTSHGGLWYRQVDMETGKETGTRFGALDAFFPAELALSGDLDRAVKLEDNAFKMWNLYGIEPEEIDYTTMKVTYPTYVLRPEVIESAYYLYHYTHDPKYLKMGETFYNDLVKYCRTDDGYAALKDVATHEKRDQMESFFLAETMKYLYLLMSEDKAIDFDKVIFNTEAHPIKRSGE
ncbi:MAG: glycoside hydrolase family 47 protein [Bacteroidota bacterium]